MKKLLLAGAALALACTTHPNPAPIGPPNATAKPTATASGGPVVEPTATPAATPAIASQTATTPAPSSGTGTMPTAPGTGGRR